MLLSSHFCDFSWKGGGTIPQISYKPSRSYPVKESPIGSAVSEILRYTQTDRQTDILLLYYKVCLIDIFISVLFIKYVNQGS